MTDVALEVCAPTTSCDENPGCYSRKTAIPTSRTIMKITVPRVKWVKPFQKL